MKYLKKKKDVYPTLVKNIRPHCSGTALKKKTLYVRILNETIFPTSTVAYVRTKSSFVNFCVYLQKTYIIYQSTSHGTLSFGCSNSEGRKRRTNCKKLKELNLPSNLTIHIPRSPNFI